VAHVSRGASNTSENFLIKRVGVVKQALKDDGCYIINDPKGLPTPAENIHNNPAAPLRFGFSCHSCLPSGGLSHQAQTYRSRLIIANAICDSNDLEVLRIYPPPAVALTNINQLLIAACWP
jgi:hypothetical protein